MVRRIGQLHAVGPPEGLAEIIGVEAQADRAGPRRAGLLRGDARVLRRQRGLAAGRRADRAVRGRGIGAGAPELLPASCSASCPGTSRTYQEACFTAPNLVTGNTSPPPRPPVPGVGRGHRRNLRRGRRPAGRVHGTIFATNEQIATAIAHLRGRACRSRARSAPAPRWPRSPGRHLKKVVLEPPASDPFILLSTDDLDSVLESAVAVERRLPVQCANKLIAVFPPRSSPRRSPPSSPGDPTSP